MSAEAKKQDAPASLEDLREQVVEAVKTVYDPEIPVNIYELGLIYKVEVNEARDVQIEMTLTSPNCPAAQSMPAEVEQKTRSIDGVGEVTVDVVWDPPWSPEHMSEAARLELGIM
ncbi:MAG: SUF system Fe-S cluster assembly protein [Ferrovibrio sp.]|jgi:FeS assembly SUF system protein|uniref:SUF system Fe-S cluster assembly protein n=1 Tax=Ferrovibrio sp. TaxID=1917215 RepID=UPI00391B5E68